MSTQGAGSRPARAVRLTFAYEGDQLTLVDRRTLFVIIPPSDDVPSGEEGGPGFWIELRGVEEEVLHRRAMRDPLRQDVEVFSPDPDESVARVPLDRPSGTFSVLLPAPEAADHVVLFGSSTPGLPSSWAHQAHLEGPVELARFSIRPEGGGS